MKRYGKYGFASFVHQCLVHFGRTSKNGSLAQTSLVYCVNFEDMLGFGDVWSILMMLG